MTDKVAFCLRPCDGYNYHNLWPYGFPSQITAITSAEAVWIFVHMCMSSLSLHSIVIITLVLRWVSPHLFHFLGFKVLWHPFLLVWPFHSSKLVSRPSHQIRWGKKRNYQCTICGHILLSSLSVVTMAWIIVKWCATDCLFFPSYTFKSYVYPVE